MNELLLLFSTTACLPLCAARRTRLFIISGEIHFAPRPSPPPRNIVIIMRRAGRNYRRLRQYNDYRAPPRGRYFQFDAVMRRSPHFCFSPRRWPGGGGGIFSPFSEQCEGIKREEEDGFVREIFLFFGRTRAARALKRTRVAFLSRNALAEFSYNG